MGLSDDAEYDLSATTAPDSAQVEPTRAIAHAQNAAYTVGAWRDPMQR
jgi:hypothetical protein